MAAMNKNDQGFILIITHQQVLYSFVFVPIFLHFWASLEISDLVHLQAIGILVICGIKAILGHSQIRFITISEWYGRHLPTME